MIPPSQRQTQNTGNVYREMDAMAGNLIGLSFSDAEKMIDLDELETTPLPEDLHARKRLELSIKKKEFEITCIQREAHHRIREIAEWKKIQDELPPHARRRYGGCERSPDLQPGVPVPERVFHRQDRAREQRPGFLPKPLRFDSLDAWGY